MVDDMVKIGANRNKIVAKLAGGAQMFQFSANTDFLRIGIRNIAASKEALEELKIPILAEDVGGNCGITIELHSEDGRLMVKTIGFGEKHI